LENKSLAKEESVFVVKEVFKPEEVIDNFWKKSKAKEENVLIVKDDFKPYKNFRKRCLP